MSTYIYDKPTEVGIYWVSVSGRKGSPDLVCVYEAHGGLLARLVDPSSLDVRYDLDAPVDFSRRRVWQKALPPDVDLRLPIWVVQADISTAHIKELSCGGPKGECYDVILAWSGEDEECKITHKGCLVLKASGWSDDKWVFDFKSPEKAYQVYLVLLDNMKGSGE